MKKYEPGDSLIVADSYNLLIATYEKDSYFVRIWLDSSSNEIWNFRSRYDGPSNHSVKYDELYLPYTKEELA